MTLQPSENIYKANPIQPQINWDSSWCSQNDIHRKRRKESPIIERQITKEAKALSIDLYTFNFEVAIVFLCIDMDFGLFKLGRIPFFITLIIQFMKYSLDINFLVIAPKGGDSFAFRMMIIDYMVLEFVSLCIRVGHFSALTDLRPTHLMDVPSSRARTRALAFLGGWRLIFLFFFLGGHAVVIFFFDSMKDSPLLLGYLIIVLSSYHLTWMAHICLRVLICLGSSPRDDGLRGWMFYDPVPISRSQHDFANDNPETPALPSLITLTSVLYKESMRDKLNDITCSICLMDFEEGTEITILRCIHHYHKNCIMDWLRRTPLCPLCKRSPFDT